METKGGLESELEPGLRIPGYEVGGLIGEGGMGRVYRGRHRDLDREVAIKVLAGLGWGDFDTKGRFRQEAKAIAQLRHPNILSVFDFGESGRTPYMVVEYLPEGSLADRLIMHGVPPVPEAVELLRGMAAAIDHAHAAGIVHRDIKPANVLLGEGGEPILADFGLAKLAEGSVVKSMSGALAGTPAYAAPEQVLGGAVGPAADRYAFATVAYELLTGQVPFADSTGYAILYSQVNRQAAAPSKLRPQLSPRVDEVILRGLAKEPRDRWPSCMAMAEALEQALAGGKGTKRRLPILRAPVTTTKGPPPRRLPWKLVAAAAALALVPLVLGGTLTALASRHSPASATSLLTDRNQPVFTPTDGPATASATPAVVPVATAPAASPDVPAASSKPFTPPPKPSPTPGASPSPTPTSAQPAVTVSPANPRIGRMASISGSHFQPGRTVTVGLVQADSSQVLSDTVLVRGDGTFMLQSPIPTQFKPGSGDLFACVSSTNYCVQKPLVLTT
jgi:serine/threonine protein kinase